MAIEYSIYPPRGSIIEKNNLNVWIRFNNPEDVRMRSMKMYVNDKPVECVLSSNGILYKSEKFKGYGINKVEITGETKRGREFQEKWKFIFQKYNLGLKRLMIKTKDVSGTNPKKIKKEELQKYEGLLFMTPEQLYSKIRTGEDENLLKEVNLMEYLRFKRQENCMFKDIDQYIFAYLLQENKRMRVFKLVLDDSSENIRENEGKGVEFRFIHFKKEGYCTQFFRDEPKFQGYLMVENKDRDMFLKRYISFLDQGIKIKLWGVWGKKKMHTHLWGKNYLHTFFDGLKNARTCVSSIPDLKISVLLNGYTVGDTALPLFRNKLNVSAAVGKSHPITEIRCIGKEGREILRRRLKEECMVNFEEDITLNETPYIVIHVKMKGGEWALTSPIWIEYR